MNSISIVSTPMQLLNCVEGIQQYGCNQNDIIICASSQKRLSQMKATFNIIGASISVCNLYEVAPSSHSFWSSVKEKSFLRCRATDKSFDYVFIGNYKLVQHRYFLYKLQLNNPKLKIVLVDDGLAICDISKRRINEINTRIAAIELQSRFLKLIYMTGNKMNRYVPQSVEFNSAYEHIEISACDTFNKNSYLYLKKNVPSDIDLSQNGKFKLLFLGQPMVQMGYLTKELHSLYIKDTVKRAGIQLSEILYIPHPTEDLTSSLNEDILDNMAVKRLDLPVELYTFFLLESTIIEGFYTSALISIHQLRPKIKIVSRYFKEIKSIDDQNERIILEEAYKYIELSGIEVIR